MKGKDPGCKAELVFEPSGVWARSHFSAQREQRQREGQQEVTQAPFICVCESVCVYVCVCVVYREVDSMLLKELYGKN